MRVFHEKDNFVAIAAVVLVGRVEGGMAEDN